jgi:hypothetical protein
MLRSIMVAALMLGVPAACAYAEGNDARWLHRVCVKSFSSASADEQAFCVTYIEGVADLMLGNCRLARERVSAGGLANDADRKAILSLSSDTATPFVGALGMKHAFLDRGNGHPERLNQPMAAGVIEALREKWPCSLR